MIAIALARSCFSTGFFFFFLLVCLFVWSEGNNRSLWESPRARERAMDVLCRSPSAWCSPAYDQTVNLHDCFSQQPYSPYTRMSTVGLGFVIEGVSSRSAVRWADIICICVIDYSSLRPVEKASVHVRLHLEECTTSEVRVCGKQETSDVRSGCERVSPDPLGYGATRQIGRSLTLLFLIRESSTSLAHIGMQGVEVWKGFFFSFSFFFFPFLLFLFFRFQSSSSSSAFDVMTVLNPQAGGC